MTAGLGELGVFVVIGIATGMLGAMVGIGAGIFIVPILVLAFAFPFRVGVATSLACVAANSNAAGSAYAGEGLTNKRLAISLEIFTAVGGVTGGLVTGFVSRTLLEALFAAAMIASGLFVLRGGETGEGGAPTHSSQRLAEALGTATGYERPGSLAGIYTDRGTASSYQAVRLGLGAPIAYVAGLLSGLLGVGGGFMKVPAMTAAMRVPVKVAAATSNFMIGVTATSSLLVYYLHGYIHPTVVAPLVLGVTGGAFTGARLAGRTSSRNLRTVFGVAMALAAVLMAAKAAGFSG